MPTEGAFASFASAWTVQRRVLGALLLREILTRYGRHNIGFLWLFVEPMIFTLGVTALWSIAGASHGTDLPIASFALTGYSAVLLWRNMPSRCIGAVKPNLSLMFHRQVKVLDVLIARLILEGAGATISFAVLSVLFISIDMIQPPEDLLKLIAGWAELAWFGMALALLLAAWAEQSELVEKLWHPAAYLIFPLSGAAFLVDILPKAAQDFVLYIPMVHCTEFIRDGYFGSKFHAHYNPWFPIIVNAIITVLALAQLRKVSREVIPE
ncbi:ABC transporter permease [Sphingomonas sp. AAP5]|jgi:ABC-2 type transport system permease protein/capsular polysaccharide transport system permease protein|uniref:ABC transporter permease n=1 Tax=Sphingomonas sp. AAP5 TaxID=1523415 RepID=UPI001056EA97|nr:ABC transporter permease [Sphingomonas sp. AAP5]QBM76844.1 ABC transporter permease [Sphingomonas sp. AAP5]